MLSAGKDKAVAGWHQGGSCQCVVAYCFSVWHDNIRLPILGIDERLFCLVLLFLHFFN